MFTSEEFDKINVEYNKKISERRKKLKKIWGVLLVITLLVLVLLIVIFPNQFRDESTAWILPVYGGMLLGTTLIGFLVSLNYISEKPAFEYLYPEIIKKMNETEDLFLEYFAYEKEKSEFNHNGGLFTKYASVKNRRHVKGSSEEQYRFDIYDCTMTTSSGKNQQTHFDGLYYLIHKQVSTVLQVRSNGSPKLKGVKYDKQEQIENIRVFKEREQELNNTDYSYIRFIERLNDDTKYKRVYFSIVNNELHLALWYKKHPARKQKTLTYDSLEKIYEFFLDEYKLINQIAEVDAY